eukprot:g32358.t1
MADHGALPPRLLTAAQAARAALAAAGKSVGAPRGEDRGGRIADIGCYVGNLAIYLVRGGASVVATDVCRGPLELARQKADLLSDDELSRLDFRLGDGFGPFTPDDDITVACLCGLPSGQLLQLLDSKPSFIRSLVLQPTCPTAPEAMVALRSWLLERGWRWTEQLRSETGGACLTLAAQVEPEQAATQELGAGGEHSVSRTARLLPMDVRSRVHEKLRGDAQAAWRSSLSWLKRPPPPQEGCVRCVCISDTHLQHEDLHLPYGEQRSAGQRPGGLEELSSLDRAATASA